MIIELANDKIKDVGKRNDIEGKSLLDIMPELKDTTFHEARRGSCHWYSFHGVEVKSPKNMHGNLKSIFSILFSSLI
jgi:hypothetical protein